MNLKSWRFDLKKPETLKMMSTPRKINAISLNIKTKIGKYV